MHQSLLFCAIDMQSVIVCALSLSLFLSLVLLVLSAWLGPRPAINHVNCDLINCNSQSVSQLSSSVWLLSFLLSIGM